MALAILGFEGFDKYSISLIFRLLLLDVHHLQQLSVEIN